MQNEKVLAINALLYILFFICAISINARNCISKYKTHNILGIPIILIYLLVSVFAVIFLVSGTLVVSHPLMRWPFLFFFLVFVIQVVPFLQKDRIDEKLNIRNILWARRLADLYLLCVIIYVAQNVGRVVDAIHSQDWLTIYVEMRGEDAQYYTNFLGQIVINLVNYLQIPVVIIAMYFYTRGVAYKRTKIILLLPVITTCVSATLAAARSDIIVLFVQYLLIYLIFRRSLNPKQTALIRKMGIIVAALFVAFFMAITFSRFGQENNDWLAAYFGESYITAHNMIGHTQQHSNGTYYFRYFVELLGYDRIPFICKMDLGLSFTTLIGVRTADFGLLGTICMYLFFSGYVCYLLNKKNIDVADLYLIMYYYITVFMGVFYDKADAITLFTILVIVLGIKVARHVKFN